MKLDGFEFSPNGASEGKEQFPFPFVVYGDVIHGQESIEDHFLTIAVDNDVRIVPQSR